MTLVVGVIQGSVSILSFVVVVGFSFSRRKQDRNDRIESEVPLVKRVAALLWMEI